MQTLYELTNGKISRKNHLGEMVLNRSPFRFVPTPNELKSECFRLKVVGEVADDSDEVKAAKLNNNWVTYPEAFGEEIVTPTVCTITPTVSIEIPIPVVDVNLRSKIAEICPIKVPSNISDIRDVKNAENALALIASVSDVGLLQTYLTQELMNKPRVRRSVIVAIQERKKEFDLAAGV